MQFEAYFDESGDDGHFPIMAVGGYLVEQRKARLMEAAWKLVLDEHGIPYFHMVDCAHEPPGGVCEGMGKKDRIQLQTKLISLIIKYVEFGIVCACPTKNYDWNVDPYSHCVSNVALGLHSVLTYKGITPDRYSLSLFYEHGHKHGGKAREYFINKQTVFTNFNFSFINKNCSGIVQAADILVWQYSKFIKDKVLSDRNTRKDFRELMKMRTLFLNVVPRGNTVMLTPFYNDSLDSPIDEKHIKEIYSNKFTATDLVIYGKRAALEVANWKKFNGK